MILKFASSGSRDIYNGIPSARARRTLPADLHEKAIRLMTILQNATELRDVASPPSNRLESLRGDRKDQYSVRINGQFRICFVWTEKGPTNVEIVDYH